MTDMRANDLRADATRRLGGFIGVERARPSTLNTASSLPEVSATPACLPGRGYGRAMMACALAAVVGTMALGYAHSGGHAAPYQPMHSGQGTRVADITSAAADNAPRLRPTLHNSVLPVRMGDGHWALLPLNRDGSLVSPMPPDASLPILQRGGLVMADAGGGQPGLGAGMLVPVITPAGALVLAAAGEHFVDLEHPHWVSTITDTRHPETVVEQIKGQERVWAPAPGSR